MTTIELIKAERKNALDIKTLLESKIDEVSKNNIQIVINEINKEFGISARENLYLTEFHKEIILSHIEMSCYFRNKEEMLRFLKIFNLYFPSLEGVTKQELINILQQYQDDFCTFVENKSAKEKIFILNDLKNELLKNGLTAPFSVKGDNIIITTTASIVGDEKALTLNKN